jgi:hypothetical protein
MDSQIETVKIIESQRTTQGAGELLSDNVQSDEFGVNTHRTKVSGSVGMDGLGTHDMGLGAGEVGKGPKEEEGRLSPATGTTLKMVSPKSSELD